MEESCLKVARRWDFRLVMARKTPLLYTGRDQPINSITNVVVLLAAGRGELLQPYCSG